MNAPDIATLRQTASRGFGWAGLSNVVRGAGLSLSSAIYAVLLSPDQIGVIGLVLVATIFLAVVQGLGASAYIVFAQDEPDAAASSILWLNSALAAVLAAGMFAAAPMLAMVFQDARLDLMLKAIALVHLVQGLGVVHRAVMQKRLMFDRLAKIDIVAVSVGVPLGIAVTASGYGLWGFVVQGAFIAMVGTLGYWAASRWRPEPRWDWRTVVRAARYSGNLAAFNAANFFARSSDDLLIGRYLSMADLGLYSLAYRVMVLPATVVGYAVVSIMVPILASLRHDRAACSRLFVESAQTVALMCFPIMVGVLVVADDLVAVFLGAEWATTATLLKIFAPVGLVQSIGVLNGVIFQATGRTDLLLKWSLFAIPVLVGSIVLGLQWGIVGVAAAYAIGYFAVLAYPSFWFSFRQIGLSVPRFLMALRRPFFCSVAMGLCVNALQTLVLAGEVPEIRLAAAIAAGMIAYVAFNLVWNADKFRQVARLQLLPPG